MLWIPQRGCTYELIAIGTVSAEDQTRHKPHHGVGRYSCNPKLRAQIGLIPIHTKVALSELSGLKKKSKKQKMSTWNWEGIIKELEQGNRGVNLI